MSNKERQHVSREAGLDNLARIQGLHDLIPEALSEDKIDWGKLRMTLGEEVDERPERYTFTWAGRRREVGQSPPYRTALIPIRSRLSDSERWVRKPVPGPSFLALSP